MNDAQDILEVENLWLKYKQKQLIMCLRRTLIYVGNEEVCKEAEELIKELECRVSQGEQKGGNKKI